MIPQLIRHIQANGPMPFDAFMERCLYDPEHGFFSAGAVRPGERGDFVTSPEISPAFGQLIGRWVAGRLARQPEREVAVVEIGSGSGSLIGQLDNACESATPLYAVERSEAARDLIRDVVPGVTVVSDIGEIRATNVVVVMNEVLDNMPAALVRRTKDGWVEVAVSVDDSESLELVGIPPRTAVEQWADEHLGPIGIGGVATVQIAAQELVARLLTDFEAVSVCIVDYGGSTAELADRTDRTIVRTYRHQHTGFDYLRHPGETDITVDVNTDALVATAHHHGASVTTMTQRHFLNDLGAEDLIAEFRKLEAELARRGDVMGQLTARSDALGVSTLVDKHGFGSFKVVTIDREPAGAPTSS